MGEWIGSFRLIVCQRPLSCMFIDYFDYVFFIRFSVRLILSD